MDIIYLGLGAAIALVTGLAAWGCDKLAGKKP